MGLLMGDIKQDGGSLVPEQPQGLINQRRPQAHKPKGKTGEFAYLEDGLGLPRGVLHALMMAETQDFEDNRSTVVSSKGATGPFQLMPDIAAHYGVDPTKKHEAAAAAGQELKWLKNNLGSLDKALAAYNWGYGNFRDKAHGDLTKVPDETKEHGARFHRNYNQTQDDSGELQLLGASGYMTDEGHGRRAYNNNFGGVSTEYTIGVEHPGINDGQLTHIPSIYDGQIVDQHTAVDIILKNKGHDPETGRFITPGGDPNARSKSIQLKKETAYKPESARNASAQPQPMRRIPVAQGLLNSPQTQGLLQ